MDMPDIIRVIVHDEPSIIRVIVQGPPGPQGPPGTGAVSFLEPQDITTPSPQGPAVYDVVEIIGGLQGYRRFVATLEDIPRGYRQRTGKTTMIEDLAEPMQILLQYGESTAANHSEDQVTYVGLTKEALYPYRALMLNNVKAPGHTEQVVINVMDADDLIPLRDGLRYQGVFNALPPLGQSQCTGIAAATDEEDRRRGRKRRPTIYIAGGEGGRDIFELQKGAILDLGNGPFSPYQNMINMLTAAKNMAATYGYTVVCGHVIFRQGLNDVTTLQADWKAKALQLFADLQQDIPTITGQSVVTDPVRIFMDQVPSSGNTGIGVESSLAQHEIALAPPAGVYWTGPRYHRLMSNPNHHTPKDQVAIGESDGYARSRVLDGLVPHGLKMTSVVVYPDAADLKAVVTARGPDLKALAIDTTTVPAATNLGFIYSDDSASTITGVTVDRIHAVLGLSAAGGNPEVEYAFTGPGNTDYQDRFTAGAWGNIRSQRQDPSLLIPDRFLGDWLPIFRQPAVRFESEPALVYWGRSDLATVVGGKVSRLTTKSLGAAFYEQATGAFQPTWFQTGGPNDRPYMLFDGIQQRMTPNGLTVPIASAFSILMVARVDLYETGNRFLIGQSLSTTNRRAIFTGAIGGDASINAMRFAVGSKVASVKNLQTGAWLAILGTYDGAGTITLRINSLVDANQIQTGSTPPTTATELRLGANGSAGFLQGGVAGFMVFNVDLLAPANALIRRGAADYIKYWYNIDNTLGD